MRIKALLKDKFPKDWDVLSEKTTDDYCRGRIDTLKEIGELEMGLDVEKVVEILKNSSVGKSAMKNWEVKSFDDTFLEIGTIAYNRFYRLALAIVEAFDKGEVLK